MKKIMALYDTYSHARQVATRLANDVGIEAEQIQVERREAARAYRALVAEAGGDVSEDLVGPETEANELGAGGGALVIAPVADDVLALARTVMEQYGLIDLHVADVAGEREVERVVAPKERREAQPVDVQPEVAFSRHHQANYAGKGLEYETYAPAYQLGYTLGREGGFGEREWAEAAAEVEEVWRDRALGTWEQFGEAVRFGWQVAREGSVQVDRDLENADFQSTRRGKIYNELMEEE